MAQSIITSMKWSLRSAVGFGCDGGCGSFGGEPTPQGITVVPFVSDDPLSLRGLDSFCGFDVSSLSRRQRDLNRTTCSNDQSCDLGIATSLGASDGLKTLASASIGILMDLDVGGVDVTQFPNSAGVCEQR